MNNPSKGSCPAHSHGHQKEAMGWLSGDSIVVLSGTQDVTIDLTALEKPSGTRLIKIPIDCNFGYIVNPVNPWQSDNTDCDLYLESRMHFDFDIGLPNEGVLATIYAAPDQNNALRPYAEDEKLALIGLKESRFINYDSPDNKILVEVLDKGSDYYKVHVQIGPNPKSKLGQCLIATAAYGSDLSASVLFLRGFRDDRIMRSTAGSEFLSAFNGWYYSFSPTVAMVIRSSEGAQAATRVFLYPATAILHASSASYDVLSFNRELAAVSSGVIASVLLGFAYVGLPASLVVRLARRSVSSGLRIPALLAIGAIGAALMGELLSFAPLIRIGTVAALLSMMSCTALLPISAVSVRRPK